MEHLRTKLLNSAEAHRVLRDLRSLKGHVAGGFTSCSSPPGLDATYVHLRYNDGRTLTVAVIVGCNIDATNGAASRTGTGYQLGRLEDDLRHLAPRHRRHPATHAEGVEPFHV